MPTSFMGSGTKYLALEEFLMDKTENITLTFIEINEIIGEKLPVPSDSAVFKAGYKVEKIDFKTKSVIFSKGVRDWILNKEWVFSVTHSKSFQAYTIFKIDNLRVLWCFNVQYVIG